ncbi:MAG: phosphodiester glycosidase family protein [Clostridia bacterium]
MYKIKIIGLFILFQIIYMPILGVGLIFYGPFTSIRDTIVTTAMTTMTHQYFATLFLSDEKIAEILEKNRPEVIHEEQKLDDIKIDENHKEGIELVDVSTKTFKGHLLIINDPSRVKLAVTPKLGKVGATTSQIVEHYDAIGGINAGGFADGAYITGGVPTGIAVVDSVLKSDVSNNSQHSIVGIDTNNKMILSRSMSYNEIKRKNIRDAVTFGPIIILNGNPTIRSGDGGWGIQPRTAIGQRKDGAILMLVADGRQADSLGATLKNVQDIFLKYNAYNAYNLDGGASTSMVYDGKVVNKPSDIMGERYVPSAFIITKVKKASTGE